MYPNAEMTMMIVTQMQQRRLTSSHVTDRDADGRRYPAPFRMRRRSMSARTG